MSPSVLAAYSDTHCRSSKTPTYIDVGGNPYGTDLHTWEPPAYEPEPVYIPPPPCVDAW